MIWRLLGLSSPTSRRVSSAWFPLVCVAVGLMRSWWYLINNTLSWFLEAMLLDKRRICMRAESPVLLQFRVRADCCPTWKVRVPCSSCWSIKHNNRPINKRPHPRCIISLEGSYKEIQPHVYAVVCVCSVDLKLILLLVDHSLFFQINDLVFVKCFAASVVVSYV